MSAIFLTLMGIYLGVIGMNKFIASAIMLIASFNASAEILGFSYQQFIGFRVRITSREPAVMLFRYGLAPDKLTNVMSSDSLVSDYSFFTELAANKTYYWRVKLKRADGTLIQESIIRKLPQ